MTQAAREELGVVFVHGLNSSPDTWKHFLRLIDNDPVLSFVVPKTFRYASRLWSFNPLRRIPDFDDVADSLKGFLETEAADVRDLVLVAHSQGGLIVQLYLARLVAEGRRPELRRIRRIVMFATPNGGSELLLPLRRSWLRKNPQVEQLNPLVRQVNQAQRVVTTQIVHAPLAADRIPIMAYAGEEDGIVVAASAHGPFTDTGVLPGDHFGILRPDSHEHRSSIALKREILAAAAGAPPVERVRTVSAAALGVHTALPSGTSADPAALPLTPYLARGHDAELRQALTPATHGGPSVLAVVTGDSSTGKSRALYEALLELAPDHRMLRPATAEGLRDLVDQERVEAGTVLWLDEAQRVIGSAAGQEAAASLRTLLERRPGVVAVATLWTTPHWNDLTALGVPGDPYGQARALLTAPFVRHLHVPPALTTDERHRWDDLARRSADPRLADALQAAAADGEVVQQVTGGPELLEAYRHGPGMHFTAAEHALLTAALDARRLGHERALPGSQLAQAAEGALTPRQRGADPDWAAQALDALTTGLRADGSRTDIRQTLTALRAERDRSGEQAVFQPADYLDQYARIQRATDLGTDALWEALITCTEAAEDLGRLADSGWRLGLRRQSVRLGCRAVMAGHPTAARRLFRRIHGPLDPDHTGAEWIARHVDITDINGVARLLMAFREAGADQASAVLLERDPVAHADLTHPNATETLLRALRASGAHQAANDLARLLVDRAGITDPKEAAKLIEGSAGWPHLRRAANPADTLRTQRPGAGVRQAVREPTSAEGDPFGRDADGTRSRDWSWNDINIPSD
ncbi:alpha/beta fold hydrolase [Streptomyces sp. Agncl-13]|uniref:alpha/beta fold hydrolase n=1 Tax=Streptomyces sp. Agncl-13 TaxID=3400628 RepID=UPI003A89401E